MTTDQPEEKTPDNAKKLLTSIRPAYTLAGTRDENASEVEEIMVKHFLNTLAEVAFSVASRKVVR